MTDERARDIDANAPEKEAVQPEGLETELLELLIDGARYDDLDDVQQALSSHVDVNVSDAAGRTALHMAAANGHSRMVDTLLNAGAEPAAKNTEGNTPLHYACLNGHVTIVRQLMMNGASASELNSYSRTPVDEALGRPFQEAIVTAVNSFYKQPLVEVEHIEGEADDEHQGDEDMGEDVVMEEQEGASIAP